MEGPGGSSGTQARPFHHRPHGPERKGHAGHIPYKGTVWLINSHGPALPQCQSPWEPEKSLLQEETKVRKGAEPPWESQSQEEKSSPHLGGILAIRSRPKSYPQPTAKEPTRERAVFWRAAPAWPGSHPTEATGQSPPSSSLARPPESIGSLSALGQLSPGLPPLTVWPQPAPGLGQVTSAVVLHSWPRSSYYKAWPPMAWSREGCPHLGWALGQAPSVPQGRDALWKGALLPFSAQPRSHCHQVSPWC